MDDFHTIMAIPAEPYIALRLPLPPSANDLWTVAGNRMILTTKYRAWKKTAAWEVLAQRRQKTIPGLFSGLLRVPDSGMDLDNRLKPIMDAAQAGGAIKNDKNMRQMLLEVHPAMEGHVMLWLWPVSPA